MSQLVQLAENRWQVDGVEFVYSYNSESALERFSLQKPPRLLGQLTEFCNSHHGERIVELGIAAGGSTALIALMTQPRKLVAFELAPTPVAALAEFIERRNLGDIVHPHYGVDQANKEALAKVLDNEFGNESIDLVIDDASHIYEATLASFEVIFPRLKEGGLFIIEDWAADHWRHKRTVAAIQHVLAKGGDTAARVEATLTEMPAKPPLAPLHRLAAELIQVARNRSDVVSNVSVDRHWITVSRGPATLHSHNFRLSDHYESDWIWALP
jgi:predicted O-methyltransferase YrrM